MLRGFLPLVPGDMEARELAPVDQSCGRPRRTSLEFLLRHATAHRGTLKQTTLMQTSGQRMSPVKRWLNVAPGPALLSPALIKYGSNGPLAGATTVNQSQCKEQQMTWK